MTVAEAIAAFREHADERTRAGGPESARDGLSDSLDLLARFLSVRRITRPADITPGLLRELIARWYVEEATLPSGAGGPPHSASELSRPGAHGLPEPARFINSLEELFNWMAAQPEAGTSPELIDILTELGATMPRAVEIGRALSRHVIERGGAFAFPEFLTSFEEGGQSRYDIDAPGDVGAVESYFRITKIEGARIEAEDVISEERLWPLLFPEEIAGLIAPGFIMNLELDRSRQGWRIVDCGFTYPPGTEI